jgi:hypothetical protein
VSFAYRSVRRRQAEVYGLLLLTGWAAIACTTLLDIDAEYTIEETGGADSGGSSSSGAGGALVGYGGTWPESGGARAMDAGNGGVAAGGMGGISATPGGAGGGGFGAEPGSGGVPPQTGGVTSGSGGIVDLPDAAGPECTPGKFAGTFDGMHAPSITVVGYPLHVAGKVTFQLIPSGTPQKLKVAEANFDGAFDLIRGVPGVPFSATMVGDYDCSTKALSGELIDGGFVDPDAPQMGPSLKFTGTFSAKLRAEFSGTWHEVESINSNFTGDGSFTARRVLR